MTNHIYNHRSMALYLRRVYKKKRNLTLMHYNSDVPSFYSFIFGSMFNLISSMFNEGSLIYFKQIENFLKWSFSDATKFAFICNYVVKRQAGTRVFTCDLLHVPHQIFRTMKISLVVYLENQIIQIKKYCWSFNINASFFPTS